MKVMNPKMPAGHQTGCYQSFKELQDSQIYGKDYLIRVRYGNSGVAVMAPHGGKIEPGTTEIADAVAGFEHTFYTFSGLKPKGNRVLHITSGQFDEPVGIEIAQKAKAVLTVHGCREIKKIAYIGGQDRRFKSAVRKALTDAGFAVRELKRFPGKKPENICNRSRTGGGVQLEISMGLRCEMMPHLSGGCNCGRTQRFKQFVAALQKVFEKHMIDSAIRAERR